MNNTVIVYTDGSSLNNNKKNIKRYGGIGVFFGNNDNRNVSEKLNGYKITNQVAELMACTRALEILNKCGKKIILYTDSKYVMNSMTSWAINWEKRGWKKADGTPVNNVELIKKLYTLTKNNNVEYKHTNSHKNPPNDKSSLAYNIWYGNMMADKLATQAAYGSKNNNKLNNNLKLTITQNNSDEEFIIPEIPQNDKIDNDSDEEFIIPDIPQINKELIIQKHNKKINNFKNYRIKKDGILAKLSKH
jgi:ribonuclease HI